jgi:uncharacterized protein
MDDTPFIKLFSSPWNKYFYDVGQNEIVLISNQLFNNLHLVETGALRWRELLEEPDEELRLLLDDGYLSGKRPSIIRHPLSDLSPYYLERKIDMITLQLTQECNFRCRYCIYSDHLNRNQRSHSSRIMTWETAKQAIDFYIKHSLDSESRSVGFYGGEPLLQFELISKIVEYTEQQAQGKSLVFHMTTNGSLLTDKVVSFLVEHDFQLLISIDGREESHDRNRVFKNGKGTFETIMKNLRGIKESYPDYYSHIHINTVLDPKNDFDSMIKLENDLVGLRKNIRYNLVESDDEADVPTPEFLAQNEYHKFLALLSLCGKYPIENLSPLGIQFHLSIQDDYDRFRPTSGIPNLFSHGGPCIAGKTRLFVTTEGRLYPCERVNEKTHMCIGSLNTGFDYQRVKDLMNVGELTAEQCKNCWAIRHCTICSRLCDDGEMLSAKTKLMHCARSKRSVENKIRSIIFQNESLYDWGKEISV